MNGLANLAFAILAFAIFGGLLIWLSLFWGLANLSFAIFGGLANLFANLIFLNDKYYKTYCAESPPPELNDGTGADGLCGRLYAARLLCPNGSARRRLV